MSLVEQELLTCFGKNEYYITNFWARVYIGSFLLAVVVSTLSIYMYQRVVRGRNLMKDRQSNDQKNSMLWGFFC
jgi:hypothetical protein